MLSIASLTSRNQGPLFVLLDSNAGRTGRRVSGSHAHLYTISVDQRGYCISVLVFQHEYGPTHGLDVQGKHFPSTLYV